MGLNSLVKNTPLKGQSKTVFLFQSSLKFLGLILMVLIALWELNLWAETVNFTPRVRSMRARHFLFMVHFSLSSLYQLGYVNVGLFLKAVMTLFLKGDLSARSK